MKRGERYGKLVAFQRASANKNRQPTWIFDCDCGRITVKPAYHMKPETNSSCGVCFKYVVGGWKKIKGDLSEGSKI